MIELKEGNSTVQLARTDSSLGYAFNKNVAAKGGINIIKFTNGEVVKELFVGIGLQLAWISSQRKFWYRCG